MNAKSMLVRRAAGSLVVTAVVLAPAPAHAGVDRTAAVRPVPNLAGALLDLSDVPSGYLRWTPKYTAYDSTDSKPCAQTLDELQFPLHRDRRVRYADVAFSGGDTGPYIVETLRYYKSGSPKRALADAAATLRRCGRFTLWYTSEPPELTAVVTVQRMAFPSVATETRGWFITVTFTQNGARVYGANQVLVLARSNRTLMILSRHGEKAPSAAFIRSLAERAAAKMRKLK
ncbi:hypothetical protein ACWEN6_18325 [Sphaerisporangium sp. NPDC004334]